MNTQPNQQPSPQTIELPNHKPLLLKQKQIIELLQQKINQLSQSILILQEQLTYYDLSIKKIANTLNASSIIRIDPNIASGTVMPLLNTLVKQIETINHKINLGQIPANHQLPQSSQKQQKVENTKIQQKPLMIEKIVEVPVFVERIIEKPCQCSNCKGCKHHNLISV